MAINVIDKIKCTGCCACMNSCPTAAIKMEMDEAGFRYPKVDTNLCINCGVCERVCPIDKEQQTVDSSPEVYAAWSMNPEVRFKSTSGGMFSELAYAVLQLGGVVAGAVYRSDNLVEHVIVADAKGIDRLRQSKYLQSEIGDVYKQIKTYLGDGVYVMFVGSPCQVAGLKSFLRKDYEKLITVDFICRGMNSPKAYRYWLNDLEERYNSKVTNVWFKYKKHGWKESPRCTKVTFENGKECILDADKNSFMRGYLDGNLYLRPSCSDCQFKGIARRSDITLADFWSIPKKLDDDKGTSMVLINSEKGRNLFGKIKDKVFYYQRSFEEVSKGNVCFRESAVINPKGEEFLGRLGEKKFDHLVREYAPISLKKGIRRELSRIKRYLLRKIDWGRR